MEPDPLTSLLILVLVAALGFWTLRPERGWLWRWRRARQATERVQREDALKHLHRCERHGHVPTLDSLAGALQITSNRAAEVVAGLEQRRFLIRDGQLFHLTAEGRRYALHVIRAHRLWERYLADETGFAQEEWHDQAEMAEHRLSPEAMDDLAAELGHPTHDPHGDPIPTSAGDMMSHGGRPLTTMELAVPLRIVHLEDEPEAVYAQLVAEGLHPGAEIRLIESSPRRVRFWARGDEHVLAPIVAANISVLPVPQDVEQGTENGHRLSSLQLGERGKVVGISRACRGSERRRFLDLGILPGTVITAEMSSPGGNPTAYRIREALVALRQQQADLIRIERLEEEE